MGPKGKILKKKRKSTAKVGSSALLNEKLVRARKRYIRTERRLDRAQTRIQSLEEEKNELLERNTNILESFQAQKLEIAARQREVLHWQKLYHDASVTTNSYEIKMKKLFQGVTSSLKEIDTMFPNLVSLSESLASNKLRLRDLQGLLASAGQDNLPRIAPEGLSPNSRGNSKPVKLRVGPMVRGMLVSKPQIILERLMLPQQQDQEQENQEEMEVGVNQLTPIQEDQDREIEEMALRNVSERVNKRRLGRGRLWQMKTNNERKKEKERLAPAINYTSSSETGESDSDHSSLTRVKMEPVVRIRDVSRLLQNSSLMKVDNEPNDNVVNDDNGLNVPSRRVSRILPPSNREDPLEGSSWMFPNQHSYRSVKRNQPEESSSDSSDEENAAGGMSHQDHPYRVISTFKVPRESLYSSMERRNSGKSAERASNEAEPDSTNNVEMDISDAPEDSNVSSLISVLSKSFPDSKRQTLDTSHFSANIVPTCASTPADNKTQSNMLSESLNPTPQFEESHVGTREKRVRRPKNNLYPGESDKPLKRTESKKTKKTKPKLTTGKKPSLNKNRKSKSPSSRKSSLNKKKDDENISKKSTAKLSLVTPRNSSIADSLSDFPDASRSSRRKNNVTYKEPSLIKKMRKP